MKLFIVTLSDMREGWQFAESLASLAISLDNSGIAVRAIEEIPQLDALDVVSMMQASQPLSRLLS